MLGPTIIVLVASVSVGTKSRSIATGSCTFVAQSRTTKYSRSLVVQKSLVASKTETKSSQHDTREQDHTLIEGLA